MSIILTTIPESSADWPAWLDRQLMQFRLVDLIEELQLLSSTPNTETMSGTSANASQTEVAVAELTLADIADAEQMNQVLESGTSAFSVTQFQLLFGHPELLLELQQWILESGSEFWQRFESSPEMQAMSDRILQRLKLSCICARLPGFAADCRNFRSTGASGMTSLRHRWWQPAVIISGRT
jgi:hypothetical protein